MSNVSNSSSSSTAVTTTNELTQKLNFTYPIVLSLLTTFGNIISFIVFTSPSFRHTASGFFLKYKSLADILNVYIGTLRYVYVAVNGGRDLKDTAPGWCYFFNMGVYELDSICSWISVLASLDRLFLVLKPSTYSYIMSSASGNKSRRIQLYSLLSILVLLTIVNSSKIMQTYYDARAKPLPKCAITNSTVSDMINLVITVAVPFALMILSSSVIAHSLMFAKPSLARNESIRETTGGVHHSKNEKSRGFIKTVLCLDACFLIFNTPRFVCQIINSVKPTSTATFQLALQISTIFKYSYYSLTIVFYTLANSLFRHEITSMFVSMLKFQPKMPWSILKHRRRRIHPSNFFSATV